MNLFTQNRPLCLASSSPRRQQLLKKFGLQFESRSPEIEETPEGKEPAKVFVARMAREKAREVKNTCTELAENVIILAGDTIVFFNGQILGKPESISAARAMLAQLSGQTHQVYSGYSILDSESGNEITDVICTEVSFRNLDENLLDWYIDSEEPFDKAGAYSIQGLGAILVESISGSYSNVVGFPIECIIPQMTKNNWISFASINQQQAHL
ncbi:MAG: septum formation protein Maf [SAR324 cluster bacterium]|nr:septum formation protein Maf [SAR324 cluster bacterium]MBL7034398.1 septum formation protein Maf [SAR324 cluster bacterium]